MAKLQLCLLLVLAVQQCFTIPNSDYEDYSGLDPVDDLVTSIEEDGIANEELEPDENGNYVIGDMVLTADQYSADFLGLEEFSGIRGDNYRWPNGVIPYQIDGSISSNDKFRVRASIGRFNQIMNGCLKIRESSGRDSSLVLIKRGRGGCGSSSVGRQGGRQTLSISVGCFNDRTIIHEFIHAFGYYHEQSRPDRDSFVRIVFNNIRRQNQHNFRKQVNGLTFNVPYDGLSIMHYSSRAFSKNRGNTIESKIPGVPTTRLGKSSAMSQRDILKLQRMYRCLESNNTGETFVIGGDGFSPDFVSPPGVQTDDYNFEAGPGDTDSESDYNPSASSDGDYGEAGAYEY